MASTWKKRGLEKKGGRGNDRFYGSAGNDELDGNRGDDTLFGDAGNDELDGDRGHNVLYGDFGNDKLDGGWGNDRLNGGRGNDILEGDKGKDTLNGGAGRDVFLFEPRLTKGNVDVITDFTSGNDTIQLDQSIFAKLAAGGLSAENFCNTGAAETENHFIIYNATTGKLLYDADGNDAGVAVEFASSRTNRKIFPLPISSLSPDPSPGCQAQPPSVARAMIPRT